MFTGIVQDQGQVVTLTRMQDLLSYGLKSSSKMLENLKLGASIAVDGVCQTVVKIEQGVIYFDAIRETLQVTNLEGLALDSVVNLERSAKFGDEIGGHILSGHVHTTAEIIKKDKSTNNFILWCKSEPQWSKYIFAKGFIAVNGVSLTIVDSKPEGHFSLHLIPETLKRTNLLRKNIGDLVNIEFEHITKTIVDTILKIKS